MGCKRKGNHFTLHGQLHEPIALKEYKKRESAPPPLPTRPRRRTDHPNSYRLQGRLIRLDQLARRALAGLLARRRDPLRALSGGLRPFLRSIFFTLAGEASATVVGVFRDTRRVGRQYSLPLADPHGFPVLVSTHFSSLHLLNALPLHGYPFLFLHLHNAWDALADGHFLYLLFTWRRHRSSARSRALSFPAKFRAITCHSSR